MTLDVEVCSPKGTYVIIEEAHLMTGHPTKPSGIGPGLIQILRHVYQACEFQDQYAFDGRPIESGKPTAWQYLLHVLSGRDRITTSGSGREGWYHAYTGFKNVISILPSIRNLLPKSLTKHHDIRMSRSPFVFGTDPIPGIELHRRADISFVSAGGVSPPRAIAIYRGDLGTLQRINNPVLREKMLAEFMNNKTTHKR